MAFSDLYLDPAQQLPPVPDPETGFPPIPIPQAPPMPPQVPGAQPTDFGNEQAAYIPPELPDFGNEQAAYQAPQAAPNPWEAWSAQNAERMRQQSQEEAQRQRELQDQIRRMEMAQGGMRLAPAEIVQLRRQMDLQRATLSQSEEQRLGRLQGGESVVQQDMANGIITQQEGGRLSQMLRELTEPLLIRRSQLPVMQARMAFIQQMQQMQQRAEVENRYSQYLAQTAQQRIQTVTLPDGSTIPLYIHADGSMHQLTPPRPEPAINPYQEEMLRIRREDAARREEEAKQRREDLQNTRASQVQAQWSDRLHRVETETRRSVMQEANTEGLNPPHWLIMGEANGRPGVVTHPGTIAQLAEQEIQRRTNEILAREARVQGGVWDGERFIPANQLQQQGGGQGGGQPMPQGQPQGPGPQPAIGGAPPGFVEPPSPPKPGGMPAAPGAPAPQAGPPAAPQPQPQPRPRMAAVVERTRQNGQRYMAIQESAIPSSALSADLVPWLQEIAQAPITNNFAQTARQALQLLQQYGGSRLNMPVEARRRLDEQLRIMNIPTIPENPDQAVGPNGAVAPGTPRSGHSVRRVGGVFL